ncbi:peptidoglycan-binding protein [Streptomyces sp. NPDC056323]|uniref:peptidoglycan-binding domain-containing protein n=1 Tax=unclassified Streptomyces TaxID=2593676 RepID=UPI0035D7B37E
MTGPHLHCEIHGGGLGSTVNPVSYLAARGVDLGGGRPVNDPGAAGATVKAVQYLITRRGTALVVDGNYGSETNSAVRASPSVNRLVVDGKAGPKTWEALVG